jgi:hypothetical protein
VFDVELHGSDKTGMFGQLRFGHSIRLPRSGFLDARRGAQSTHGNAFKQLDLVFVGPI